MDHFLKYLSEKISDLNKDNKPILVIGNSPDVLQKKIGKEIDEKYFIIRFNKGCDINQEYSDSVGCKTDLKVFCSLYFVKFVLDKLKENEGSNIIIIDFKTKFLKRMVTNKKLECYILKKKINNNGIKKNLELPNIVKKKICSSGLIICYSLLEIFDKIYIYGFSHTNKHYYPNKHNGNSHGYKFEKIVFEYYETNDKIIKL
jgi:hypothetical protein